MRCAPVPTWSTRAFAAFQTDRPMSLIPIFPRPFLMRLRRVCLSYPICASNCLSELFPNNKPRSKRDGSYCGASAAPALSDAEPGVRCV